jgi:hypothetical protein
MEAQRDENHVTTYMGVSYLDGITPIPIAVNPDNGRVLVDAVSVIQYTPEDIAARDENYVPVLMGTSSFDDFVVLPLNVNLEGKVLIDQ